MAQPKKPTMLKAAVRYIDRDTARDFFESIQCPDGPVSLSCGSVNVGYINTQARLSAGRKAAASSSRWVI